MKGKLSKSARWYRKATPEQRKKHKESSEKWNKSKKGKMYKAKKNATEEEKRKRKIRAAARLKMGLKRGDKRVVHHKKMLSKGGGNDKANLEITSAKKNNTENKK